MFSPENGKSWLWWCLPATPTLLRLRQEDPKYKPSVSKTLSQNKIKKEKVRVQLSAKALGSTLSTGETEKHGRRALPVAGTPGCCVSESRQRSLCDLEGSRVSLDEFLGDANIRSITCVPVDKTLW